MSPASQARFRAARRLTRRKDRTERRLFLAEGPQAVREAIAAGAVADLFVSEPADHLDLLADARAAGVEPQLLGPTPMAELSDTVTPQGVVAVCRMPMHELDLLDRQPRLVLGAAQVRDPGNAGTLIRCADAFGADAVVLTAGSVDPYNGKAVRASAGSLFHLPVLSDLDLEALVERARSGGLQVLAADGHGDVTLDAPELDLARPTLWLMGNEAWGLPVEQRELADTVVRIPIRGAAESLNLAAAAAVCLYASSIALYAPPPE